MHTYGPRLAYTRTRSPARSGTHSPASRERGLSMTRCNCESTSQATRFSRTVTTGSASKRCSCASTGNASSAAPATSDRSMFIAPSCVDQRLKSDRAPPPQYDQLDVGGTNSPYEYAYRCDGSLCASSGQPRAERALSSGRDQTAWLGREDSNLGSVRALAEDLDRLDRHE